ncbi:nucleoside recognition domain-containing protein [Ralstonia solanacearum]|uniref:nucleoside recognition domain-containing protein n=1 Tax=Ralstonia solanacearum TaxID=305 RepID=UPI0005AC66D3|nr:nucleoside recognition domain-containing protein [Ralstonia solanacearum]
MALNLVWLAFFLVAFVTACVQVAMGDMEVFSRMLTGMFDAARTGFEIALGLTGMMALWLGIMRVGEQAGVVDLFARLVNPLMRHLFPSVPPGHSANGAMMMNVSANVLGLDNAATPLGLQAMRELQAINPQPQRASDAQLMFVVLNTAGVTLVPTSVIAIRQALAVKQGLAGFNAADIFLPTLLSTFVGFCAGIAAVAWHQRINLFRPVLLAYFGGFVAAMGLLFAWLRQFPPQQMAAWIGLIGAGAILTIVVAFLACGALRRINVYETFVDGAKDGFQVAIGIVPYLVAAVLVGIAVFRAAGCMDALMQGLSALFSHLGIDTRFVPALPVGLMKTLSGAGARGLMVDVMTTYGVDSFQGKLAAIIQGSTETTFYVLAVYFGSVGIKDTRYALACGLWADLIGLVGAVLIAYLFFG